MSKSTPNRKNKNQEKKIKGRLLALEGIDGCGKQTQSKLLLKQLKQMGKKAVIFSFPRYQTETGQRIKNQLKVSSKTNLGKLFSQDFLAAKTEIERYLKRDYFVICDRYISSNEAYQQTKTTGMPPADLIIFLNLTPQLAEELKKNRKEKDAYEKNFSFLKEVYQRYCNLAQDKKWITIKCFKDKKILPPGLIAQKIWQAIKKLI